MRAVKNTRDSNGMDMFWAIDSSLPRGHSVNGFCSRARLSALTGVYMKTETNV